MSGEFFLTPARDVGDDLLTMLGLEELGSHDPQRDEVGHLLAHADLGDKSLSQCVIEFHGSVEFSEGADGNQGLHFVGMSNSKRAGNRSAGEVPRTWARS